MSDYVDPAGDVDFDALHLALAEERGREEGRELAMSEVEGRAIDLAVQMQAEADLAEWVASQELADAQQRARDALAREAQLRAELDQRNAGRSVDLSTPSAESTVAVANAMARMMYGDAVAKRDAGGRPVDLAVPTAAPTTAPPDYRGGLIPVVPVSGYATMDEWADDVAHPHTPTSDDTSETVRLFREQRGDV